MRTIQDSWATEREAKRRLEPFIAEHSNGRYVVIDKGTLAKSLQATVGDVLMSVPGGVIYGIEIKAERVERRNLYLETWSNRNLEDPFSHAERGSNPGWMVKSTADLLFYYFLDTDTLFVLNMLRLKRWAFGFGRDYQPETQGKIYAYPEKPQKVCEQLNDTWGRCVPIDVLRREVGLKQFSVQQLQLEQSAPHAAALSTTQGLLL